jgi:plasmid stability protein
MGEVPEAMVEAGAREIDPYAFTGYRYGPEAAAQSREAARDKARAILTAALRLDDPETVERVAKAIDRDLQKQWNTVPPAGQVRPQSVDYERTAEVAIRALLNTTEQGGAG